MPEQSILELCIAGGRAVSRGLTVCELCQTLLGGAQIEVVGKNLFYFFGSSATDTTVLHFHFGMSGAFKTYDLPGREPTPTTRLQLVNQEAKLMAHLSAMTVQHGGIGSGPCSLSLMPSTATPCHHAIHHAAMTSVTLVPIAPMHSLHYCTGAGAIVRSLQLRTCPTCQGSNLDETIAELLRLFLQVADKLNFRLVIRVLVDAPAPVACVHPVNPYSIMAL